MMEPTYAEDIIVGVVHKKSLHWFITEKVLWQLDFEEAGITSEEIVDSERKDIMILDETTIERFLHNISSNELTTQQLREQFQAALKEDQENALYDYRPSLYINFDEKRLFSMYPELISFEEYVPAHWNGTYEKFYHQIEQTEKYWCIDNFNYFERN